MMKRWVLRSFLVSVFYLVAVPSSGFAQDLGSLSPQWELGGLVGRLLPHQVDGVTEVMSLTGAHLGYRLAPLIYVQSHVHAGRALGQDWKSLGLSLRMDQTLEDFLVSVFAGAQTTNSLGAGTSEKNETGAFVGGALMMATGGPTWLKADMNFGFGPGTTLFISLALLFRFG